MKIIASFLPISWNVDLGQFGLFLLAVLAFFGIRFTKKPRHTIFGKVSSGNANIHQALVDLDTYFRDKTYNVSLVLKSNGGNNPKVGHPLFQVVVDASDEDSISQFGNWYNRERVDASFYKLWNDMLNDGGEFAKIPCQDFNLHRYRSWLMGNGCVMTYMFLVGVDNKEKESYVLYVNRTTAEFISDESLNEIRRTVHKIRNEISTTSKRKLSY